LSEWEPATEGEAAMREALAVSDQEHYFRILERSELVLPVAADVLAGRVAMGWGTWTQGNRTHVLAFTSPSALTVCLSDAGASYRSISFQKLAAEWPNYEWWLAVNPGLPIEAYLPSWFVSQLSRGDVRLPGRTMGARARIDQSEAASAHGRGRVPGSATPGGPGAAKGSATVTPADPDLIDPGLETVDAEILDAPAAAGAASASGTTPGAGAASGTARVYPNGAAAPSPSPERDLEHVPNAVRGGFRPAGAGGTIPAQTPPPAASVWDNSEHTGGARRDTHDAEIVSPAPSARSTGFTPANDTESQLLGAVERNNTDAFLSTLLLARVIVPVPGGTPADVRPRDRNFPWIIEEMDGQRYICVFTSPERMAERGFSRYGAGATSVSLRFVQLIGAWPGEEVSFAINPGSPVGAKLPGSQIVALASWAAEVGLRDEPTAEVVVAAKKAEPAPETGVAGAPTTGAERATIMQRTILPSQLSYYLERGYDRISGFVNRASEVSHLATPKALYRALGLLYAGSPFHEDDTDVHVLRWLAHRTGLYRLPYGGPHEAAMRAMQGWVIERPPFRGNGFAPGDTDVIAEFKVDSVRLPHGAQIWRLDRVAPEVLVATFDADSGRWVPAAGYFGGPYA
jgi:hypothetical protein